MCDRTAVARRWLAALVLATAVLLPSAAPGQSADRLRARLVAVTRRGRLLKDSLTAIHAMRSHEFPPDSIVAEGLQLRFLRSNIGADLERSLQAAAERAMVIADSVFGSEAREIAGVSPILVTRAQYSSYRPLTAVQQWVELEIGDGGGRSTYLRPPVTQRKLEDGILDLLGTMATAQASPSLINWAGEWVPSRPMTKSIWAEAAIDMASSNAAIARTCHAGSAPACESALGLTQLHDALTEWYAPEGYRVLVSSWKPPKDAYSVIADRAECVEKKDLAVCERLARTRPVPIPLTFATRESLMALALERGGKSAYSRLLAAKGTPLQMLSAAAGVAPDSLIREWRARVVASAPKSTSPSPAEATLFLAWTLLFGFAASRRRP